jgi:hypothetical protein
MGSHGKKCRRIAIRGYISDLVTPAFFHFYGVRDLGLREAVVERGAGISTAISSPVHDTRGYQPLSGLPITLMFLNTYRRPRLLRHN